jgi:hypothetical protein
MLRFFCTFHICAFILHHISRIIIKMALTPGQALDPGSVPEDQGIGLETITSDYPGARPWKKNAMQFIIIQLLK